MPAGARSLERALFRAHHPQFPEIRHSIIIILDDNWAIHGVIELREVT
jgi:hypothetical protein